MSSNQEPFAGEAGPEERPPVVPEPIAPPPAPRRRSPALFWPLIFIGVGVILLLWNLGYLPSVSWSMLWRLWPLLLIAIGIEVLLGRRSTAGAIVSTLLVLVLIGIIVVAVFFAQDIPYLSEYVRDETLKTKHIEHPLKGVERATVNIDWSDAPGYLGALDDSGNLIEGDISYRNSLSFHVKTSNEWADVELFTRSEGWSWFTSWPSRNHRWDIQLNPDVTYDLSLDAGSGSCTFELNDLQIEEIYIDGGSGSIELTLPADQSFEATIDGGSGSVTIFLPSNVGAKVILDSGSGAFSPDSRFEQVEGERRDDGVWETENYGRAEHTIVLRIDQGSGSIRIRD